MKKKGKKTMTIKDNLGKLKDGHTVLIIEKGGSYEYVLASGFDDSRRMGEKWDSAQYFSSLGSFADAVAEKNRTPGYILKEKLLSYIAEDYETKGRNEIKARFRELGIPEEMLDECDEIYDSKLYVRKCVRARVQQSLYDYDKALKNRLQDRKYEQLVEKITDLAIENLQDDGILSAYVPSDDDDDWKDAIEDAIMGGQKTCRDFDSRIERLTANTDPKTKQ